MDGGNFKLFPRTKKRSFVEKNGGIVITPAAEQDYDRRALFVKVYHAATQVDIGDMVDSQVSQLEDAKSELMKAEGRLIDTVILDALVSAVSESSDASEDATTKRLTAAVSLTERRRLPFYHEQNTAGDAVVFDVDTIEDILHIFAIRDVEDDLCATLTPGVKNILRKESDFKNAENIFAPMKRSVDDNRQGFSYKGINWISISQSVLPLISRNNVGFTAAGSNTVTSNIQLPSLELTGSGALTGTAYSYTGANKTSLADVTAAVSAYTDAAGAETIQCRSADILYIWGKSALLFADRAEETFSQESLLPLLSYAKQGYMRVSFGAMLLDDEYVMAVPIKGTLP